MSTSKNHKLFTTANAKMAKSEKFGYLSIILHLSPHKANYSKENLCPNASKWCIATCLNTSGLGFFDRVQNARKRKSNEFLADKIAFVGKLKEEVRFYLKKAEKLGKTLTVRLNGTTDINYHPIRHEGQNIFETFPDLQFYDYTKSTVIASHSRMQKNHYISFSWSGENELQCLSMGGYHNIAVPFHKRLPSEYQGVPVFNGDDSDLRFLDPSGVIIGLLVKGNKQKKQTEKNPFLVMP